MLPKARSNHYAVLLHKIYSRHKKAHHNVSKLFNTLKMTHLFITNTNLYERTLCFDLTKSYQSHEEMRVREMPIKLHARL